MDQSCCHTDCIRLPDFICRCSEPWFKLCKTHLQIHLSSNNHLNHNLYPAFKMTSNEQKPKYLQYLKDLIKSTKKTRKCLQQQIESFVTKSSKLVDLINKQIKELSLNLKFLLTENRIMILPNITTEYQDFKISYEDIHFLKLNFKYSKELIRTREEIDLDVQNLVRLARMNEDLKEFSLMGSTLYAFKSDKKLLNIFPVGDEKLYTSVIPNLPLMGSLASIIRINRNEIFVYGGKASNCISATFIINTTEKSFKQLQSSCCRFGASPTLYENKIYVFGGLEKEKDKENSLSVAHYFDMVLKNWKKIQDIPVKIGYTSTLKINKKVLISGEGENLFVYLPKENSYKIATCLNIKKFNILIPFKDRILLVTDSVYFSNIEDFSHWESVGTLAAWKETTSKPMIRGKFCYFAGGDSEIYKFDCVNFNIKTIANY